MTIATLLVSFFGLLIIGAPVAVALGGSAMFTSFFFDATPAAIVGIRGTTLALQVPP